MARQTPAQRPGPTQGLHDRPGTAPASRDRRGTAPGSVDRPGRRPARRFRRLLVLGIGAVAALLFVLAGVALAYFVSTDSSHPAQAAGATLAVPTAGAQHGAATPTTVPIQWTTPAGYTPTGYTVLRCTGSSCTTFAAITNGGCSGTVSGTTCTDTDSALAAGTTYTYEVKAQLDNWVSTPGASFNAATSTLTSLTFTTQPTSGQPIQATGSGGFGVTVAIEDAHGNVATNDSTDTVTLAIASGHNPGSGALTCSTSGLTVRAASGVATFTGCDISKVGTGYELTASSSTNTSLAAPANPNSFNITAGNVSQFAVGGIGATETAGTQVTNVTLTAEDQNGNVVTGFANSKSITWSGPTNSPNGTAPTLPTGTVSFTSGLSTTPLNVTFTDAGSQTLTATDQSLTGSATTTVSPGLAAKFAVGGVGVTATAGTPVTGVTLTAADGDGNTVTSYSGSKSITWSGPTTSPNGTPPTLPTGTVNFSSGASTTALSVTFTHAGSQTLTATQGTATGSATTTVNPGTASKFGVSGLGTAATAGTAVTNLTLTATDADGNTVPSYTGSQTITWSGPMKSPNQTAPTLPTGTVSFTSGVSTTSLSVTFTDAASQTLTATQGSITGSATITVSGAAPASLVLATCSVSSGITPAGCASSYTGFGFGSGGTVTAYVQALDQYGNAATISGTISLSVSSNNSGKYSISAGTTLTISGTATPANQSTGSFTVSKVGTGNASATITVHVTSGATGVSNLTFSVAT
jgi:hypothetical protein